MNEPLGGGQPLTSCWLEPKPGGTSHLNATVGRPWRYASHTIYYYGPVDVLMRAFDVFMRDDINYAYLSRC